MFLHCLFILFCNSFASWILYSNQKIAEWLELERASGNLWSNTPVHSRANLSRLIRTVSSRVWTSPSTETPQPLRATCSCVLSSLVFKFYFLYLMTSESIKLLKLDSKWEQDLESKVHFTAVTIIVQKTRSNTSPILLHLIKRKYLLFNFCFKLFLKGWQFTFQRCELTFLKQWEKG